MDHIKTNLRSLATGVGSESVRPKILSITFGMSSVKPGDCFKSLASIWASISMVCRSKSGWRFCQTMCGINASPLLD